MTKLINYLNENYSKIKIKVNFLRASVLNKKQ